MTFFFYVAAHFPDGRAGYRALAHGEFDDIAAAEHWVREFALTPAGQHERSGRKELLIIAEDSSPQTGYAPRLLTVGA